jgi:hypothetical protein
MSSCAADDANDASSPPHNLASNRGERNVRRAPACWWSWPCRSWESLPVCGVCTRAGTASSENWTELFDVLVIGSFLASRHAQSAEARAHCQSCSACISVRTLCALLCPSSSARRALSCATMMMLLLGAGPQDRRETEIRATSRNVAPHYSEVCRFSA